MKKESFFNRDLSWLSFNERVLLEAGKQTVPLLERIKFLSIYSSNLDEFYRVRMPVLMILDQLKENTEMINVLAQAKDRINQQQQHFGEILSQHILPDLANVNVNWIYNQPFPDDILKIVTKLFFTEILTYLHPVPIEPQNKKFFAENNKLYQAVILLDKRGNEKLKFINIPSDVLPRLFKIDLKNEKYVVFLDDIIKYHLNYFFPDDTVKGIFNIKITRDAELKLEDEPDEDLMTAIKKELAKRDYGAATRFLCEPNIPLRYLYRIVYALNLQNASVVKGGVYHNLKDLGSFPHQEVDLEYQDWPPIQLKGLENSTIIDLILQKDILINVPYQSYDPVIQFFNEAANDGKVEEIYCTLYRVAMKSRIVNALITAAKNGKKVTVMLELKARFDEANNIKWSERMKAAGVKIIYSRNSLKVHAKVALIKRKDNIEDQYLGLLATGNFNETTAKFYTDHILFTSHQPMLKELKSLFSFLAMKKNRPAREDKIDFKHLLVAQFNLQEKFLFLINREILNAKAGNFASIIIKLNNLEEKILISKLYEASREGVKIQLIVRGICCLVPGLTGQSEHITVRRIVDRYLEHGRIFIFHNNGNEEIFIGSADWMNRNIYGRIEVCFPLYQPDLKRRIKEIIDLQLADNVQAEELDAQLQNRKIAVPPELHPQNIEHFLNAKRSQKAIYELINTNNFLEN